jgi:hypothetical protein
VSDLIIKPEVVEAREKQKNRELQHERRQLAYGLMCAALSAGRIPNTPTSFASEHLGFADALIEKTSVE